MASRIGCRGIELLQRDRQGALLEGRQLQHRVDHLQQPFAAGLHLAEVASLLRGERPAQSLLEDLQVPQHRGERRAQLVRDVGEELVLDPPRLVHGHVLPVDVLVALGEARPGAAQLLRQQGTLGRGRHLVGDEAHHRPLVRGRRPGAREVEGDRAEHATRGHERHRRQRAEAEFLGDLLPVLERRVGVHVGHLDRAPLAHRLAARPEAHPHPHLAEPRAIGVGPPARGGEPHQLAGAVHQVHRRKARPGVREHAIERELEDLLRLLGREEGVHDLAHGGDFVRRGVGRARSRAHAIARERGGSWHEGESTASSSRAQRRTCCRSSPRAEHRQGRSAVEGAHERRAPPFR